METPILSVAKQAEITSKIIDKIKVKYVRVLLLELRIEARLSSWLSIDCPSMVDGAVLLSSSMALGEERIYGISYLIEKILCLFPRRVATANKEKMPYYDQLKEMEPLWNRI